MSQSTEVLDVLMVMYIVWTGLHPSYASLTVSPDYVLRDAVLTLRCETSDLRQDVNVSFYKDNSFLDYIKSNGVIGDCFNSQDDCSRSPMCTCDFTSNVVALNYTASSTSTATFSCEVFNGTEVVRQSKKVLAAVAPSNVVLSPSSSTYSKPIGTSLEILCSEPNCWPNCTTHWYGPGVGVNDGRLVLTKIQKSDAGDYQCNATNVAGSRLSSTVRLTVQYAPENVTITPPTTNQTKNEGSSLGLLTCSASCEPSCQIKWLTPNSAGVSIQGDDLSIRKINRQHTGKYTCRAENSIGSAEIDFWLDVLYPAITVSLSPTKTSYNRTEGDALSSIQCSADCRPACEIEWIYPNLSSKKSSSLSFGSIQRSDQGTYTCRATNSLGTQQTVIHVTVNYGPSTVILSPKHTDVKVVKDRSSLSIYCSADCRPVCTYQWTGPNGYVTTESRLYISASKLFTNFTGNYRCRAGNGYGGYEYSQYVLITVHTFPSQVKEATVSCTGPNTASLAWIPDLTVFPKQNFTVQYRPKGSQFTPNNQKDIQQGQQGIMALHLDNLNPSTIYEFRILSKNTEGTRYSSIYSCSTQELGTPDSDLEPVFIGGIIMILLSVVLIVTLIVIITLRRWKKIKSPFLLVDQCISCFKNCKIQKDSPDYVNTNTFKENFESTADDDAEAQNKAHKDSPDYVNSIPIKVDNGSKGSAVDEDPDAESKYTELKTTQADYIEGAYSELKVKKNALSVPEKPYANIKVSNHSKEKEALRPPNMIKSKSSNEDVGSQVTKPKNKTKEIKQQPGKLPPKPKCNKQEEKAANVQNLIKTMENGGNVMAFPAKTAGKGNVKIPLKPPTSPKLKDIPETGNHNMQQVFTGPGEKKALKPPKLNKYNC